jgi:hypothetical protein
MTYGKLPCAFCDATYSEIDGQPRIACTHEDGRRYVVGACGSEKCQRLLGEMQRHLRDALAAGPTDDLPGLIRRLQQRLLGVSVPS